MTMDGVIGAGADLALVGAITALGYMAVIPALGVGVAIMVMDTVGAVITDTVTVGAVIIIPGITRIMVMAMVMAIPDTVMEIEIMAT